ncbi:MAG: Gfo/Idh/MocA family oxidoreductase [Actinobacteria bacterium]|nr:MAG: Gfo/Idh/MocA family oxidoreductase [Actinomycetota bacterium]
MNYRSNQALAGRIDLAARSASGPYSRRVGGAETKRPAPVRVGFIGAGSVLWAYLQMIDRLAPRGVAVAGPIGARRREIWDRILTLRPGAELVATAEEVVGSDVDVVVILTSASSHAELARLALEHGKHVLVEKPFAGSPTEGAELAELARARDRHLVAAPFVHLAPTFRALWTEITDGAIGQVHTARGLYGVPPPDWNTWMYQEGPLSDLGIYNLKSLTTLLGPVAEVMAAETATGSSGAGTVPDVIHLTARHEAGALSSVVAGWEIHAYRRPGLELYGTEGTANLVGDDWDPLGYQIFRTEERSWRQIGSLDPTWLWTDGLRDLVVAVREGRAPLANIEQDLHLLDVLEEARRSASERVAVPVTSRFQPLDLRLEPAESASGHIHDHTRSPDEQR